MNKLITLSLKYFILSIFSFTTLYAQECGVVYVAPNGAPAGVAGTKATPANLAYGLTLASPAAPRIWMAVGSYPIASAIQIPSDITIEGGFDPANAWTKSNTTVTSIDRAGNNPLMPFDAVAALAAANASNFRLQDLTINVGDAMQPVSSLYGIYLFACSNYNIVRCIVNTGAGAPGIEGAPGVIGVPGPAGAPGNPGANEQNVPPGGAGGVGVAGNSGGNGGVGSRWASNTGNGVAGLPAGCGGAAGTGGTGPGCGCGLFGTSNNNGCGMSPGTAGSAGGVGVTVGTAGVVGPPGAIVGGYFVPGTAGTAGTQGSSGCGGGGGGGGGGRQQNGPDDVGGSGGGGGAGGEGGFGGTGGFGGGGSFAVFLFNNGAGGSIVDCFLNPGPGGAGGVGGAGGAGGLGGAGGAGGPGYACGGNSAGGPGGAGGAGAAGGPGGAGAAGPSVALSENGGTPVAQNNIVSVPGLPPDIFVQNPGCTNSIVSYSSPQGGAWNFGAGAVPSTGNGSGPISVIYPTTGRRTVTLAGTTFTDFIEIFNLGPTLPSITPANPTFDAGCPNDFTTSIAGTNYDWTFGPTAIPPVLSGAGFQTATGVIFLVPGTYTIYVVVTTACCGQVLDSTVVTVTQSILNVNLTASDDSICAGDPLTFTADGNYAAYDFYLNGASIQAGANNTYTTNAFAAGDSLTVIAFAGSCFTNPSDTLSPVVSPIPTVTLASSELDNEICEGDLVTFTATAAGMDNYEFFDSGVSVQSGASNTYATTTLGVVNSITVIATDNGCASSLSNAIVTIVNLTPIVTLASSDPDDKICTGDNITFTASPNTFANYEFFDGATSIQNGASNTYSTTTLTSPNSITVVATSAAGCVGPATTAIVTLVTDYPVVTLSSSDPDDIICSQDQIIFTAAPAGFEIYDFYNGVTLIQSGASNTYTTSNLPSVNDITVIATNFTCVGPASNNSVTQVIPADPINAGNDFAICIDGGIYTPTGFTPAGGVWTGTGVTNGATGDFNPATAGVGVFDMIYSYTNVTGCVSKDTLKATVNDIPDAGAGNDVAVCLGSSIQLNASGGGNNFLWSPATGLDNATIFNPVASPIVNTTYTVTITNSFGCDNTDDITVTVDPVPSASFTAGNECDDDAVSFSNTSTPAVGVTYDWNFGDASTSTLSNPSHLYGSEGNYVVRLVVTLGNCSDSASTTVTVYPRPDAFFIANPTVGNFLNNEINFTDASTGATQWNWIFDDGTFSSSENPNHFYLDTGLHPVILIVSNDFGCSDTADGSIRIDPYLTFYVPNAFTPDGDGINDVFFGYGEDIYNYEMRIFTRWGPQIFNSFDKSIGWDGTNQLTGKPVPPGVYVYRFLIKDVHGRSYSEIGRVSVVK